MNEVPSIGEIESWLKTSLPSEYRNFLETCNGEWVASELVLLYGRRHFVERNETYETKEYCPGYVTIGNDSGDMEILMSLQDATIYMVDGGAMQMTVAEPLNTTFSSWLRGNCPLPKFSHDSGEWPVDPLTPVSIFLETKPTSISNLLMIKRHLKIDNSIGELKAAVDHVPCRIAGGITYAKARIQCRLVNQEDRCLGIRLADDEARRLPIETMA